MDKVNIPVPLELQLFPRILLLSGKVDKTARNTCHVDGNQSIKREEKSVKNKIFVSFMIFVFV